MKVLIAVLAILAAVANAQLGLLDPIAPGLLYTRGIDNIANLYGNFFSPLSYSSGSAGVLNLTVTGNFFLGGTNFGYIVPSIASLLNGIALSSLLYTESGSVDGVPYFISVSGLQNVAVGLALEGLVQPKLYSQRSSLSAPLIEYGFGSVNVSHLVIASGLAATASCQASSTCYPTGLTDPNLAGFQVVGEVTFVLVPQGLEYRIAQINNVEGLTFKPVTFEPTGVSFGQW